MTKANDFKLPGSNKTDITLSNYRGKYVILYFYPKDNTPGCTQEACDFRDHHAEFIDHDVVILGISKDSIKRHENFITKHNLPFILLSDEDQTVHKLYDTWKLKKNYGKEYYGTERSTFLIDPEGKIIKEWRKVRVKGHIEAVLAEIKKIKGEK